MSAEHKFLFDTSFEAPQPVGRKAPPPPPKEPAEEAGPKITEADLLQAREEGIREGTSLGREQGRTETFTSIEQTTQDLLNRLTDRLGDLMAAQTKTRETVARNTLEAASTIIRKLLPSLEKSVEMNEIESVVSECLERAHDEPRLVVRVSEQMLEPVKHRVDTLVASEGFEGKVVFLAADGFGNSDVRIEWADGGAERNVEHTWREIDQVLARFLKIPARSAGAPAASAAPAAAETVVEALPISETPAQPGETPPPLVSPVTQMGLKVAMAEVPVQDAPQKANDGDPLAASAVTAGDAGQTAARIRTDAAKTTENISNSPATTAGTQEHSND
jgi:flagellar assembly protein FliH